MFQITSQHPHRFFLLEFDSVVISMNHAGLWFLLVYKSPLSVEKEAVTCTYLVHIKICINIIIWHGIMVHLYLAHLMSFWHVHTWGSFFSELPIWIASSVFFIAISIFPSSFNAIAHTYKLSLSSESTTIYIKFYTKKDLCFIIFVSLLRYFCPLYDFFSNSPIFL